MRPTEILNFAGFIIGIVSLILSIIFFLKGSEKKSPKCYYKTSRVISKLSDEDDPKIKIFYRDNEVTRVFTTRIWVWNSGKKPIRREDIPSKVGITLSLFDEDYYPEILDSKIILLSRPETNFSIIQKDQTSILIGFDFLDKDDGAVLEIQHSGSKNTEVKLAGVILGTPEGVKILDNTQRNSFVLKIALKFFSVMDYIQRPKIFIPITSFFILALVSSWLLRFQDLRVNQSVRIKPSQLQIILQSELPMLTEDNFTAIMEKIIDKSNLEIVVMGGLVVLVITLLVFSLVLFLKLNFVPYPKSLKEEDENHLKNEVL